MIKNTPRSKPMKMMQMKESDFLNFHDIANTYSFDREAGLGFDFWMGDTATCIHRGVNGKFLWDILI